MFKQIYKKNISLKAIQRYKDTKRHIFIYFFIYIKYFHKIYFNDVLKQNILGIMNSQFSYSTLTFEDKFDRVVKFTTPVN